MKRIISIKPLMAVVTILLFAIAFKSCKKGDNEGAIAQKTELTKLDVIKKIKEQYGDVSGSIIIPVNKEAEDIKYKNLVNNKMVDFNSSPATPGTNGILKPCFWNCSNATNASQFSMSSTLKNVQRTYYVQPNSSGYKNDIIVNLELSLPFTPLNADPNNANNISNGSILITPPFGPSYGNNDITPVAISFIGADPACPMNNKYKVSFTWSWVTNDINFTNGYQIDVQLDLYNNCPLVGNFVSFGNFTSTLAGMIAPCDRTDNVWTPAGGGPGNSVVATGNYITVNPPSGWVTPDLQQLEYRAINNSNYVAWEAQNSTIYYGRSPTTNLYQATFGSFNGFVYLTEMIPGSGNWIVRFRNIKSPTCIIIGSQTVPPPGPYSPPYNGPNWPGNWAYRIFNL